MPYASKEISVKGTIAEDTWVEYSLSLGTGGLTDIREVYFHFGNNGKQGDVFYVDYVRFDDIKIATNDPVDFDDNESYAKAFSAYTCNFSVIDDSELNEKVLQCAMYESGKRVNVKYDNLVLPAGTQIIVKAKYETSTGTHGFKGAINGIEQSSFWYTTQDTYTEQTMTLDSETTLQSISLYSNLSTAGTTTTITVAWIKLVLPTA